jgi:hypothetical protein
VTRVRAAAVPLLLLASCRAHPLPASGNDRDEERRAPVATVAGRPLFADDVARFWYDRYREEYLRTVDDLLDERMVEAEARRLGLAVPTAAADRAVAAEEAARRRQLREAYGEGADLASEVDRVYGLTVDQWKARVLRPRLEARLLLERVVRADTRGRARVRVRVIVLPDAARAAAVTAKLRAGADFSLTALRESVDPTAKVGGDLPPVARGDLAFPGVEERLFAARTGDLVGPLEVRVEGRPQWQVYKVVDRTEPWVVPPAELGARLEQDLAASPLTRGELERWRARARRDLEVRVYAPTGSSAGPPAGGR